MEDREFDEFCVKHGFDPEKLDALTTCWLKYSMLDDIRNAERVKNAQAEAEDSGDRSER